LYRDAAAERSSQTASEIKMLSISTRGTENNKKLMKLIRGGLSFELCRAIKGKSTRCAGNAVHVRMLRKGQNGLETLKESYYL